MGGSSHLINMMRTTLDMLTTRAAITRVHIHELAGFKNLGISNFVTRLDKDMI